MARVLPLLLLFGVFFVVIALLRRVDGASRSRPAAGGPHAYRPRRPAPPRQAPETGDGAPFLFRRADLQGLRDAYTSAPIDPTQPLHACATCQAMVHDASLAELRHVHQGRCPVCAQQGFRPVRLVDGG